MVSVIVPIYNVEKYVRRCLESILQQTLSDIEIIVVNDCTPDRSMTVVNELAGSDRRIKTINLERNAGTMVARQKGYMTATGDYITFCDGDDYLPQTALEKLYLAAIDSNADIVCGNHLYITTKGDKVRRNNVLRYGNTPESVLRSLLRHELGHTLWGKLFKASLLQDYEYRTYEHATNGEDGCLFYQVVANIDRLGLIDDVVYCYVQNTESSSQIRRSNNALESICIANATIVDVASEFQELRKDLTINVSTTLVSLIYRGYNKNGTLSRLFSKYGLEDYYSNKTIIKSHPFQDALKLLLKKYILENK